MSMGVNLIPGPRRRAQRQRRRLRRWLGGLSVYALALLLGWGGVQLFWGQADTVASEELAEANRRLSGTMASIEQLRPRLARLHTTLAASRSVGSEPDWSLMLALLGEPLDEQLALSRVEINPVQAPNGAASQAYLLRLHGLGANQQAVSAYILRLERLGLFHRVELVRTQPEVFLQGRAIGFEARGLVLATQGD